jgi:subtilisin-like proprotein convertase family protein
MRIYFVAGVLAVAAASQATQYIFSSGQISIPDLGVANPSPVNFNVAGLDGLIVDVDVRFNNLTHSFTDDIGAVIFDPTDVGVILFDGPGSGDGEAGVTWSFDDAAAATLSNAGDNLTGSYKPGQNQWSDPFTGAPNGHPYNTSFAPYNGTSGLGTWRLFIEDFVGGDSGSIGSVDLIINTNPVPEPATMAVLGLGALALLRKRRK